VKIGWCPRSHPPAAEHLSTVGRHRHHLASDLSQNATISAARPISKMPTRGCLDFGGLIVLNSSSTSGRKAAVLIDRSERKLLRPVLPPKSACHRSPGRRPVRGRTCQSDGSPMRPRAGAEDVVFAIPAAMPTSGGKSRLLSFHRFLHEGRASLSGLSWIVGITQRTYKTVWRILYGLSLWRSN